MFNIEHLVMWFFYILVIIGLYTVFDNEILYWLKRGIHIIKKNELSKKSKVIEHLEKIFEVTNHNTKRSIRIFIYITSGIFILFFVLLENQGYGIIGVLISGLLAILPYLYIRSKLATVRISGSFEAALLITEMVNQYKINSYNIFATIDACIPKLDDAPISQKALFNLSMKLKTYNREEDELKNMLDQFVFTTRTTWAMMLSNNIYNAVVEKVNVLNGFEDLLRELKKVNKRLEKDKRENLEGATMVKLVGPAMFLIFAWVIKSGMDYSWKKIIAYEFLTPTGLMIFIIIVASSFINAILINILGKPKYDF